MATTPVSPPTSSPNATPPAGYGLLVAVGFLIGLGVVGGAFLWLSAGQRGQGAFLAFRLTLVGIVILVSEVASRLLQGVPSWRLFAFQWDRYDLSMLGLLGGLFVLPTVTAPYLVPQEPGVRSREQLTAGQPVQIAGPTLDGGRYDLAQHRGRVVVVDFWATWCPPCVAELPNVRAVYDEYHDRGVDFVSVSLDTEREKLEGAVKAKAIPWPQIFFDPKAPPTQELHPAERYGIDAIPCLLVLDRDGKLLARGVRGPGIRRAVARALGESVPETSEEQVEDGGQGALGVVLGAVFFSFFKAPWWLLAGCTLAGTLCVSGLQMAVRRLVWGSKLSTEY